MHIYVCTYTRSNETYRIPNLFANLLALFDSHGFKVVENPSFRFLLGKTDTSSALSLPGTACFVLLLLMMIGVHLHSLHGLIVAQDGKSHHGVLFFQRRKESSFLLGEIMSLPGLQVSAQCF